MESTIAGVFPIIDDGVFHIWPMNVNVRRVICNSPYSEDEQIRALNFEKRSFRNVSALCGDLVSTDQEPYLDRRDDDERRGEIGQSFGVVGNSFIGRFWPYYLAGAVSGALIVSLMLWLNRDRPRLPSINRGQKRE